jgi:hypothetical protein
MEHANFVRNGVERGEVMPKNRPQFGDNPSQESRSMIDDSFFQVAQRDDGKGRVMLIYCSR